MDCDVVVVGAGPAGSTAAKHLAEKGLQVILLDKHDFPRNKPCGGGLPAKVLKHFPYLEEKRLIDSYTFGGKAFSSSLKYAFEFKHHEPVLAMVTRESFDHGLLQLATESGAQFAAQKKVVDVHVHHEFVQTRTQDGTSYNSQLVIGADGVFSTTAQKTGLSSKNKPFGLSVFDEINLGQEQMDALFTKQRYGYLHLKVFGLSGYGWVFPKKESVNIGVGEMIENSLKQRPCNLKNVFIDYIKLLKQQQILPQDLTVRKMRGAALPIYPLKKTYSDRVLLCGDAAGLINPLTGEGIDFAMYSGKIAADVATQALTIQDTSARFLSTYQRQWKHDFGKDIKLFYRAGRLWKTSNENFFKRVSKDEILSNLVIQIVGGNVSAYEYRWTLLRRLLYLRFKEILKSRK